MSASFPPEIIREILLKVPVESLLRCKSVCKEWYFLISDQHFIQSHYYNTLSSSSTNNIKLICNINYGFGQYLISCPFYDVLFDKSINNHIRLEYPLQRTWSRRFRIVGSCNGLMCIHEEGTGTLFIYNPTTRTSNLLPCSQPITSSSEVMCYYHHGFGYDELSHDYKVVKIANQPKMPNIIYSLKTGKCKEIGHFPCAPMLNDAIAKFSNGALHWASGHELSLGSWRIVSLDLANEAYGEVLPPEYHQDYGYLDLGVLGEWLCVLCTYKSGNFTTHTVDVWVMKVYGVKDSWTKLASIPNPHTCWGRVVTPFCISQDGKLLLQFKKKLVVYDLKDSSSSVINKECFDACILTESLVSPFPPLGLADNDDEDLRKW